MPASPSKSFSTYFGEDDFAAFVADARDRKAAGGNGGAAAYQKLVADRMVPALSRYLGDALKAGRLAPLEGAGGRKGYLIDGWNGLFADDAEIRARSLDLVAHSFAHAFIFKPVYHFVETGKHASEKDAYAALISAVDRGDLDVWDSHVDEQCQVSGDRLKAHLDSWQLRMVAWNGKGYSPMQAIAVEPIHRGEVEFETGDLLIADWFRIEEFTRTARDAEDESVSINSNAGCVARTREYLDKLGFVSVFVGNTSPGLFVRDGALVVGWADEDEPDAPEAVGSVCTDLWWTTIIDRKRLVDIVAAEAGAERADRIVEDYLRENDVNRLKVAPGTYHLCFSGAPETFTEAFASPDLELPRGLEPMFTLSPRPLELVEKRAATTPAPR